MGNPLTTEQVAVVETVLAGDHVAVEALAGTGKTTTLASIPPRGASQLYVTFNRDPVNDAKKRMPHGTRCATIYELASRSIGDPWVRRTRMPRLKTRDLADLLGIGDVMLSGQWGTKRISATMQAGLALRAMARFSISADPAPGLWHIPVPRSARHDPDLMALYTEIGALIAPTLPRLWGRLTAPDSDLPLTGANIIKLWQLQGPVLPYDRIMVDEAQDMNDCYRSAIEQQMTRSQLVAVGDSLQQINAWNGSINALAKFPIDDRLWLTRCWRFGPEIADIANRVLAELDAPKWIIGAGTCTGPADLSAGADVILCRTNAQAVHQALDAIDAGQRPHIVGGADDVVSFARGALALQEGGPVNHPELICFDHWLDVLAYVASDELGADLAPMVNLIERFGADTIVDVMGTQPDQDRADVILSTVHKVKGREWPDVRLAPDFSVEPGDPMADVEELRLLYVAVTRAQDRLDITDVPYFQLTPTTNRSETP